MQVASATSGSLSFAIGDEHRWRLTSLLSSLMFTPDNISFGHCAKESGRFNSDR